MISPDDRIAAGRPGKDSATALLATQTHLNEGGQRDEMRPRTCCGQSTPANWPVATEKVIITVQNPSPPRFRPEENYMNFEKFRGSGDSRKGGVDGGCRGGVLLAFPGSFSAP